MKQTYFLYLLIIVSAFLSCSRNAPTMAGGTSNTGNAIVQGRLIYTNGAAAAGIRVYLRPKTFLPGIATPVGPAVATTDAHGFFSFSSIESGIYIIESLDGKGNGIVIPDILPTAQKITIDLADRTLKQVGKIQGSVEIPDSLKPENIFIQVYGLNRSITVDSSGQFIIADIPEGVFFLHLVTPSISCDPLAGQEVYVVSGLDTKTDTMRMVNAQIKETTPIYYSVGIGTTALYQGTGSAVSGTLTLDSPAPDNVGMGDEVRAGQMRYYISRRNSSHSFQIQTAFSASQPAGATTISFNNQSVEIYRAFNSLGQALDGNNVNGCAADSGHLNTLDLVSGNYQLSIACYADGTDSSEAVIRGWTTSPINPIRIFTPVNNSEVGTSQRHHGNWGANGYRIHITATRVDQNTITCMVSNVQIDGLQIGLTSDLNGTDAVEFYEQRDGRFDVSNCIIHGAILSTIDAGRAIMAYTSANNAFVRFWNNIIDGFSSYDGCGIRVHFATITGYAVNNTFVNCHYALDGYLDRIVIKNTIASGCTRALFPWGTQFYPGNDYNVTDCAGPDFKGIHSRDSVFVNFKDPLNWDFHLAPTDTVAKDHGVVGPISGLYSDDIDGEIRTENWDIGADEVK